MKKGTEGAVSPLRTAKRKRRVAVAPAVRALDRERMLQKLPRERRQIYDRISKLREDIGTIDFDVVLELRNLRHA